MKTIHLFANYDSATLFAKVRGKAAQEIDQWPEAYFAANQINDHLTAIRERYRLRLPEVDFLNGREHMKEKVCPLSTLQPGAKQGVNVRVNVLTFEYSFMGDIYLLGCYPSQCVPEPSGVCFVDPANHMIAIEYTGFNKSTRQILSAHRDYLLKLTACYALLEEEFETFNGRLAEFLYETADERRRNLEAMKWILSSMSIKK